MMALRLKDVSVSLHGQRMFAPLTFTADPGVVTSVIGPSGAGKSSLLAHLSGALRSELRAHGEVCLGALRLDGLAPEERRLGILFQDDLLFPHLSVGGNLAFGMHRPPESRRDRRLAIAEALELVGLRGFEARDPATLSGGQRSRVALLRVLLSEPRALLLDEPFARLDARTRADTRQWVLDEIRRRGLPTVLVTHDRDDVAVAAGPIVELQPDAKAQNV